MTPVQLALLGDPVVRVPVAADAFWLGRDTGCDLCLWDLRVSRRHARVARVRGEYVLSSEGRHGVYVNGKRVPMLTLRDGDEIALTPPDQPDPVRLRFENSLQDVFVAPGTSLSAAWIDRERGLPGRERDVLGHFATLGPFRPDPVVCTVVRVRERGTDREAVVKTYPRIEGGDATDAFLRLATALAGARHPALARVLEAGLYPVEDGVVPWLSMEVVDGRAASLRIPEGPQTLVTVVRRLRGLAAALHLLHSRGAVHGNPTPSNVLLRPDGGAVLVDFGRSLLRTDARPVPPERKPEPSYTAPEVLAPDRVPTPESDVYALAATGFGMLAGRPPFGADPDYRNAPPTFESLSVRTPAGLEDAIRRAVSPDPAARPTAEDLGRALAFVDVMLSGRPT